MYATEPFREPEKVCDYRAFWAQTLDGKDWESRFAESRRRSFFFFFAAALVRKETGHFASTNLTAFTEGHHQVRPSTGFFCWINITNRPSSVQFFFLVVGFVVDK